MQTDGMEGTTFRLWKQGVRRTPRRSPGGGILARVSGSPRGPGAPKPSAHCPPRAGAASSAHAPGGRAAPHASAAPSRAAGSGWGLRAPFPVPGAGPGEAAREPRCTLAQVVQRELGTQRVNNLPGHLPTSAPNSAPPYPLGPPSSPKSPFDPHHGPASTAFVLAATKITIPEEEVPGLLVALQQRVREERAAAAAPPRSPHSPRPLPANPAGGPRALVLTSHREARAPKGAGGAAAPATDGHRSLRYTERAREDRRRAPPSDREFSRASGRAARGVRARAHAWRRRAVYTPPSAPILSPATRGPVVALGCIFP